MNNDINIEEEIDNAYKELKSETFMKISNSEFRDWVMKKGYSLYQRDFKRTKEKNKFKSEYNYNDYRKKICEAIKKAPYVGKDYYTGEKLDLNLIGKYQNSDAKQNGKAYKRKFALMPTVDHINAEAKPEFVICSWRMNDAKNDLSECGFTKLCIRFLRNKGIMVKKNKLT